MTNLSSRRSLAPAIALLAAATTIAAMPQPARAQTPTTTPAAAPVKANILLRTPAGWVSAREPRMAASLGTTP